MIATPKSGFKPADRDQAEGRLGGAVLRGKWITIIQ